MYSGVPNTCMSLNWVQSLSIAPSYRLVVTTQWTVYNRSISIHSNICFISLVPSLKICSTNDNRCHCPINRQSRTLKPSFHYPSWRPELTAWVDGWPVSITRQHGLCWRVRVSTSRVDGPSTRPVCWQVMETGHPSTQAVNSESGNRA